MVHMDKPSWFGIDGGIELTEIRSGSISSGPYWHRKLILHGENGSVEEIDLYSHTSAEGLMTPAEKAAKGLPEQEMSLADDLFGDGYEPDARRCPQEAVLFINWRNHGGKTDAEKLAAHIKEAAGLDVAVAE